MGFGQYPFATKLHYFSYNLLLRYVQSVTKVFAKFIKSKNRSKKNEREERNVVFEKYGDYVLWAKYTPLLPDKEIQEMIDKGVDVDEIMRKSFKVDSGDLATMYQRYPEDFPVS